MENKKYTVSQIFSMCGDTCEQSFSNLESAEKYADELAVRLSNFWIENSNHSDDEEHQCNPETGMSNELKFSEKYCSVTNRNALIEAFKNNAITIIEE